MPKLDDPGVTKACARILLLQLYFEEPRFAEELSQVLMKYLVLLAKSLSMHITFTQHRMEILTEREYDEVCCTLHESGATEDVIALPDHLAGELRAIKQADLELRPYIRDLERLAFKWKLRAAWAAPSLHISIMCGLLWQAGMPSSFDVPLDMWDIVYTRPPPLPDLEIKVSAWAFVVQGRREIQRKIARTLTDYELRLKATGLSEYPSSLERHARWWFEHFVHGKKYDDIAQEEAYTPGGSVASYARNVGEAVRRFSRLVGLDSKNLRRAG